MQGNCVDLSAQSEYNGMVMSSQSAERGHCFIATVGELAMVPVLPRYNKLSSCLLYNAMTGGWIC